MFVIKCLFVFISNYRWHERGFLENCASINLFSGFHNLQLKIIAVNQASMNLGNHVNYILRNLF